MISARVVVAFCILSTALVFGVNGHGLIGSNLIQQIQSDESTEPSFGLIGGRKTNIHKHPYQAAIFLNDQFSLSGAILNEHYIVTQALPLNFAKHHINVAVGKSELSEAKKHRIHVEEIILHPAYSLGSDYAVSLLKLKKPLKFSKSVRPIEIAKSEPKHKSKASVTGWGARKLLRLLKTSNELRELSQTILSRKSCKPYYTSSLVSASNICAQSSLSHSPTIFDHGDPLVQNNKLVGIFLNDPSIIPGLCSHKKNCPVIYTNLVVLRKWIKKTIKHH